MFYSIKQILNFKFKKKNSLKLENPENLELHILIKIYKNSDIKLTTTKQQ